MPTEQRSIRVAVVGGGVAGLAAGFRLREELRHAGLTAELVIFEQEGVCGGATRTEHEDGFSLDRGPNGWLSNEPLTARLIEELGLTGELVPSDDAARLRFIFTRGKRYQLPMSPGSFLVSGLLRPWEKLRVLGEFFTPRRRDDEDESIYEFGCRRLGRGFAETMLDPMVSGIFAGNVRELSLPATFPKMRAMELEYGGLFKALLKKARARKRAGTKGEGGPTGPSGVLTTLRGGVGRLTERLAEVLAEHVRTGQRVTGLTRADGEWVIWREGAKEHFDAVVLAPPAYAAAELVAELSPDVSRALTEIGFADVAVLCHAYDTTPATRRVHGFGHLIPRREGLRALGCLWTSCIFPQQVPGEELLLRTILGGATDPDVLRMSDAELLDTVRDNTTATLGLDLSPRRTWLFRHPRGIAQYTLGHRARVAAAERLSAELPGLAFVGASYRGVSLNRCVRDAYTVAPRVLRCLGLEVPDIPEGADRPAS